MTTVAPASSSNVTTRGGTANAIPIFTTATNSILTQTATTGINIGGNLNLPATGKANSSTGFNSQPQDFVASVFNGTLALPETFQWQAEPVNNNKKTATGTLNLLFGSGGTKPAETGLNIASNGQITFAAGQTFPGGTVTGNESVNGNLSARGVVTGSSYQIGSNLFAFGSYANSNAFLGFAGNTGTTGFLNAASGYQALFSNTSGSSNTATGGGALYSNTTGNDNTGSGADALFSNTTGGGNTASGVEALKSNSTACCNTASGYRALYFNSAGTGNAAQGYQALYFATGSNNTGLGTYAGNPTNSQLATGSGNTYIGYQSNSGTQLALNNATAIGANAEVDASNSMVLGSINGVNGATASTNVGIGTTTPAAMLDVHGTGNFTGPITFAAGQTFPGGTVTGNESVNGNVSSTGQLISTIATGTAPLSVNSTTQVANLNASLLGGAPASAFATVGANAFTGNETVNGNLSATGVVSGSSFQIGSNLFDYGSYSSQDAFLGFAGNGTISGTGNTASGFAALSSSSNSGVFNTADGFDALSSNTSGFQNTASGENALTNNTSGSHNAASGEWALEFNTTGSWNTAFGAFAGYSEDGSNITGSNNTFIGYQSAMSTGTLNNATAIGANAEVDASNSMVLGSINGVNGATVNTLVGIGTTAPRYLLHIGSQGVISYNNFLRVDGPASGSGNAISVGGHGDVGVDAVDVPNGRFVVKDNGIVAIGIPNPLINPFQIKQGLGHAIADGWTTYSSRRWKTNIQTLHGALAKIEQLRGVSYELKIRASTRLV